MSFDLEQVIKELDAPTEHPSIASDVTFDMWCNLPISDTRTIDEFVTDEVYRMEQESVVKVTGYNRTPVGWISKHPNTPMRFIQSASVDIPPQRT
jgi:hypothetical protein